VIFAELGLKGSGGVAVERERRHLADQRHRLAKEGELDAAHSTVTWTITVTQGTTVSGHLFVNGFVTVTNSGTAGATIGNIVVSLQTKSGSSWVTQSSDIADATHGDAATTAHIGSGFGIDFGYDIDSGTQFGIIAFPALCPFLCPLSVRIGSVW